MKKLLSLLLAFLFSLSLSSCQALCSHDWAEATCISPKTCMKCGKEEGINSSTHSYADDKCLHCGIIRLTLDNYDDYFEISGRKKCVSPIGDVYSQVECNMTIEGNSNYEYQDVTMVIEFSYYDSDNYISYIGDIFNGTNDAVAYRTYTSYAQLNLSGSGSAYALLFTNYDNRADCRRSEDILQRTTYKVVSISGTATKN